ncbi:hypothetical protein RhiirA4_489138 [Rhizophagus irregularis]|uniref:Uncharacterized protein n=1 Tax=Rhizophagus irregularis TaxID=588596 RepID=A0A2I1HUH9_9GLOM|nr:hypothetical protein RhiirA4_489138 [Rhizophagus irregularis]
MRVADISYDKGNYQLRHINFGIARHIARRAGAYCYSILLNGINSTSYTVVHWMEI